VGDEVDAVSLSQCLWPSVEGDSSSTSTTSGSGSSGSSGTGLAKPSTTTASAASATPTASSTTTTLSSSPYAAARIVTVLPTGVLRFSLLEFSLLCAKYIPARAQASGAFKILSQVY
jgi:hypothetical protein